MSAPAELAPGLWRWTARHPEWHPGEFGREVASYALRVGDELLLIDPLVAGDDAVLDLAGDATRAAILVTIPYHVRSAEPLWRALTSRGVPATIHGHPAAARRLSERSAFRPIEPGEPLPGGAEAFAIGRPRRYETPLWLPSHRAIAFGDAVVESGGELRVWAQQTLDDRRLAFYRERFTPTLEPLLGLDAERVLVTHGEPVLRRGREALRRALSAPPWYHRPS